MASREVGSYEVPPSLLASLHSLPNLPQIPGNPLGAFTDSIFEAEDAQAQAEYKRRYADVLRQLGYVDPQTGKILKGALEIEADRQRADLWRSTQLAGIEAVNQAQAGGNYFSGYHPVNMARMQHPFQQGITDINTMLPKALADQMDEAARAFEQFVLGRNLSLAQAAARGAEAARNAPAGGGDTGQGTQQQWDWEKEKYGWSPGDISPDAQPWNPPVSSVLGGSWGATAQAQTNPLGSVLGAIGQQAKKQQKSGLKSSVGGGSTKSA